MERRLFLTIRQETLDRLIALAADERRDTKQQAALLLTDAVERAQRPSLASRQARGHR